MKKQVVTLTVCFLFGLLAIPQEIKASYVVKYISNLNGLTNNSVNCILEDKEHTIWIGTCR